MNSDPPTLYGGFFNTTAEDERTLSLFARD